MRINVIFREENENIELKSKPLSELMNVSFSDLQYVEQNDYEKLKNKPMINSVVLQGAITAEDLGLGRVYYDTTAGWNSHPDIIAEKSVVYIYSDYKHIEDENGNIIPVAGMRIGDGTSYLIDMPFVSDAFTYLLTNHVSDASAHVSSADRTFWNNKVSAYIDHSTDAENLVLSKNSYELNGEIINYQ